MKMVEVVSSNVKKVGYEDASKTLFIEFTNATYAYENVDRSIYEGLLAAESKGSYVSVKIRESYKCRKLDHKIETEN